MKYEGSWLHTGRVEVTVRKLTYYIAMTLDGYISGPNGELDHLEPTPEEHQYANDLLRDAGAMVLGRGMYQLMAYWDSVDPQDASQPAVALEFATIYQSKPRYVLSRTLTSVDDKATLIRDDVVSVVAKLKEGDGGYLGLGCGPELLALFMSERLVDEISLLVLPIVLGEGNSLFRSVEQPQQLRLTSTRVFERGSVLLNYDVT